VDEETRERFQAALERKKQDSRERSGISDRVRSTA
jgi:hypothetical protein